MLNRLILKVTKFQLPPLKRLGTVVKNMMPPPMSNRVKDELDCFNCKTGGGGGGVLRLFISMFTKESNYNSRFCEKYQLVNGEYSTIIKKN